MRPASATSYVNERLVSAFAAPNSKDDGQQEAHKHQQSDSPNEQSGTEIMIANGSRHDVSVPEKVVRCVEFVIRPGMSGSQ